MHALAPTKGVAQTHLVARANRALHMAKTSDRNRMRADGLMPVSGLKRFSLGACKQVDGGTKRAPVDAAP